MLPQFYQVPSADGYPLCDEPGCRNEARYYERRGNSIFYLRWCGIHDILRNGGLGRRKDELVPCTLCAVTFWDADHFALHEQDARHRGLVEQRAQRLQYEARRNRWDEGKRR